jgi:hypothetical protein
LTALHSSFSWLSISQGEYAAIKNFVRFSSNNRFSLLAASPVRQLPAGRAACLKQAYHISRVWRSYLVFPHTPVDLTQYDSKGWVGVQTRLPTYSPQTLDSPLLDPSQGQMDRFSMTLQVTHEGKASFFFNGWKGEDHDCKFP